MAHVGSTAPKREILSRNETPPGPKVGGTQKEEWGMKNFFGGYGWISSRGNHCLSSRTLEGADWTRGTWGR